MPIGKSASPRTLRSKKAAYPDKKAAYPISQLRLISVEFHKLLKKPSNG
ncbi:MAG: hypothetical protein ACI87E_004151 [Mariniblastus sp.]|jgi:hypothetical protein